MSLALVIKLRGVCAVEVVTFEPDTAVAPSEGGLLRRAVPGSKAYAPVARRWPLAARRSPESRDRSPDVIGRLRPPRRMPLATHTPTHPLDIHRRR
ncbi:unnamed protein product [Danaus chrysippus]|uniref:(African queen) hypothetical protein n=1 Tax=Danaus chrysippus TaxID=151541 RepID=A0A8J2R5Y0_9NEOP|nr:unnamed protein product [Danaus chrysippus]